jgi:DNA-binding transcriptional MerR regulator
MPVDDVSPATAAAPPPEAVSRIISFTPVDRGERWGQLRLHASQVAALSGATLRQVMFWADQGYVPHVPGDARTFSGAGLDTVILIVQAREAGVSLKRAAGLARQYLAAEFVMDTQPARAEPSALGVGLRALEEAARELREQVAPEGDATEVAS